MFSVKRSFKFAHHGTQVREYAEGDTYTPADGDDPELIAIAEREGWIEQDAVESKDANGKRSTKAHKGAPENK